MKRVDERTTIAWDGYEKSGAWSSRQEENIHVSLLVSREKSISGNADDNSPRHYSTSSVQPYTGSQQNHERVRGLTYTTTNVYQSQHKNAYNPFASALADAFGIEEAYS
jgi:hypothetical protein